MAKAAGGHRNLGLMPELARPWETPARRALGGRPPQAQRQASARAAQRGRVEQALFCEPAVAEGMECAVAHFDLVKRFECVAHETVRQAGARPEFDG
eukprot:4617896-Pyramimonas_sp.AAC.1